MLLRLVRRLELFVVAVTALSVVGCATSAEPEGRSDTTSSIKGEGSTCEPGEAEGAVTEFQKALHDAIAFAEGTKDKGGKDGYNVGFAYKLFASCGAHPNIKTCSGKYCSTAAGRYQFLKKTWDATAKALGTSDFGPDQQELGAQHLIAKVRKVSVPQERAMTATEFSGAMKKLSYEWASLPPGRYGQPSKTQTQMRSHYCEMAGC